MDKEEIVIGLYTYSTDSKAAAVLLKYFCKKKNNIFFAKHGEGVPKGVPDPLYCNVKIVTLGVNVEPWRQYDESILCDIRLDGKTSACKTFYDMTHNPVYSEYFNPIPEYCLRWIDVIASFQVRTSSFVIDDVQAFGLACSIYDTYPRDNSINNFWDNLINNPEYFDFVMANGKEIFEYKKSLFEKLSVYIDPWDTPNGDKCLIVNKRDMDSQIFQSFKGYEKYDFFVAYSDSYPRETVSSACNDKDIYKYTLCNVVKHATMVFTVYRNNPNKSSIEFTKPFGGVGHDGVSTFKIKMSDYESASEGMLSVVEQVNEHVLGDRPDLSPTVKKWINQNNYYRIKIALNLPGIRLFNILPDEDLYATISYIKYSYSNECVVDILDSIIMPTKNHSVED